MALNKIEQNFCNEYVKDYNPVQAYIRASSEEDAQTAYNESKRLLQQNKILRRIFEIEWENRGIEGRIRRESIVEELKKVAFADIKSFIDVDDEGEVTLKNLDDLPEGATRAISKIEVHSGRGKQTVKLELSDRENCLFKLGEYLGLNNDLDSALTTLERYDYSVVKVPGGFQVRDLRYQDDSFFEDI